MCEREAELMCMYGLSSVLGGEAELRCKEGLSSVCVWGLSSGACTV